MEKFSPRSREGEVKRKILAQKFSSVAFGKASFGRRNVKVRRNGILSTMRERAELLFFGKVSQF